MIVYCTYIVIDNNLDPNTLIWSEIKLLDFQMTKLIAMTHI